MLIYPFCFNPHTHAGCDYVFPISVVWHNVSIHTPTQGVTFHCKPFPGRRPSFNPHTHAGCDNIRDTFDAILQVSIHTPTQGVTILTILFSVPYKVSIHTPTQGVTVLGRLFFPHNKVSIHTPTQGVTAKTFACHASEKFQSTHPRRV